MYNRPDRRGDLPEPEKPDQTDKETTTRGTDPYP